LYGNRAISVQSPHSLRKLSMGSYGARAASMQRLYGDTVTVTVMMLTISWNMAGSILRYDLKSPRDSRTNFCIRVSKCPMVTHGFTSPRPFSLCASLLPAALPESRMTRAAMYACSLLGLLTCLDCNLRYAVLSLKGSIIILKSSDEL